MNTTYTPELITAFSIFALAASVSPGPNNSMLMASGANFGLRLSLPHILGVVCGYVGLIGLCGLGVAAIFNAWPILREILKWSGAFYLVYLAWKIATAKGFGESSVRTPLSFGGAAAFQLINPKAWIIALATVSTYVPSRSYLPNLTLALAISATISLFACFLWTIFGMRLRRLLLRPRALILFNIGMASILLVSLIPLIKET